MTPLERRYRRLLRVLPRWYRADREEEMVDTFLTERADRPNADLDLEHGSPGWAEVRATAVLAVRTRFAATRTAGDVVRLVACVGLLAQFVMAVPSVVHVVRFSFVMDDALMARALVFDAVSMAPIVLLLLGLRRSARVVAVLAVAPSLLWISDWVPMAVAMNLPFWLAVGCLLVGFHREAPPIRPAPWWLALAAAVAGTAGWLVLDVPHYAGELIGWLLVAGGTFCLIRARTAAVALAVTVFAVPFLPMQFMLLQEFEYRWMLAQLAATGALVVVSALVALRRAPVSVAREASTA